ncbi:MAG: TlpA disulfide reductase family protein [Candidatus Korobacteraceae bacterium]
MKKLILIVVAIVLAIVLYKAARHHTAQTGAVSATSHSIAPDFALTDLNGQALDLSSYRGKVVLLDFWATWCTPCRAEIPHFVEFQNSYRDQGLQVIGISMDDDLKPVGPFYKEYKMNYPVALGSDKLAQAYGGILGLPVTFLIGRDGHIQAKYVGAVDISTIEQEIKSLLQAK